MSIKDQLDQEPEKVEGWKPEPGEELIGEVLKIDERSTEDYPEPYPIVVVRKVDGEKRAFHAFHLVAKNLLAEERPQPGDEIGIRYLGLEAGKTYNYHNYRIVVDRQSPAANDESVAATQRAGVQERAEQDEARSRDDDIPF